MTKTNKRMDKSKVYFTNLRTTPSSNLLDKMERLVKRAGITNIDFKNQFVAIKIHFGEPGTWLTSVPIMPPAWLLCFVH